jgi:hypothetical protein
MKMSVDRRISATALMISPTNPPGLTLCAGQLALCRDHCGGLLHQFTFPGMMLNGRIRSDEIYWFSKQKKDRSDNGTLHPQYSPIYRRPLNS